MNQAIKNSIQQLGDYFENFELHPPAPKSQVEKLRDYFPYLSLEIIDLYDYCNGFNVHLKEAYKTGILLSLDYIFETMKYSRTGENPLFTILFPLRNDGCWNFDCLLMNNDMGNGSVLFWDNGTGPNPDYLLAGSLENYFKFLAEDLITRHHPDGSVKPEYDIDNPDMLEYPWPFNNEWIGQQDADFAKLNTNENFKKLLEN